MVLASCGQDVRDTPLAGLDLNDRALVASLRERLAPDDRAPFATYALLHWPGSRLYCGSPPNDGAGREPETIGEAIEVTLAREEELEKARAAAVEPQTDFDHQRALETRAIDRVEELVLKRDMLATRLGPDASKSPEWKRLKRMLDEATEDLAALRRKADTADNLEG